MGYWEYYLLGIILLPGLIFAIIAQSKVYNAFHKYDKVISAKGITGAEAARMILKNKGIFDVQVVKVLGEELSDNFNPETNIISLSPKVFDGTSISALGVAAHEAGHAVQHAEQYKAMKVRTALVKVGGITSRILWPLVIIGLIFNFAVIGGVWGSIFLWSGCAFFGISVVFSLITLPVELDASNRAFSLLVETGSLDSMEILGVKKVLNAAALTYIAALVVSILSLLRFVLYFVLASKER